MALVRTPGRRVARAAAKVERVVAKAERAVARRPRRRIRLDNDARRAQLLELGQRAFAERTYDEVSIDDIARAAGISKGLLYHYYPTKRDLYVAGLQATADDLLARTVAAADPKLPPLERIRAGLDAYLDFVVAHARPFAALLRGGIGSDPEVAGVIEGTRTRYVERLLSDTENTPLAAIAASEVPMVRIAVRGWLGFVEAASLEWLIRGQAERVALRDLMVDTLLVTLRGVLAPVTGSW
ncbi:MAG: TetR/AcrR family transcriptional regulator [Myxococcales bacterium]|nr:TetR/AcrR family transcriptional regulator [Myxococcales bacterium]